MQFFSENRYIYIILLSGLLLFLAGLQFSIYSKSVQEKQKKLDRINKMKYLRIIEVITNKLPLIILSRKLNTSLGYFMFDDLIQRSVSAALTLIIPVFGLVLYSALNSILDIWYTKLITLALCIMVPYYMFTLVIDYMKYNLRLKIPILIDNFRSSFITHNRIKPALQECSANIDKRLGNIMLKVSDSSDLNKSLCAVRDRINDSWFNIFVVLLINYRENGGELINQLYKLNKTITRYNNIEKKKNKRLIWYEIFTLGASIFSIPTIIFVNRIILGANIGLHFNSAASYGKIMIYSLSALLVVRILRRL